MIDDAGREASASDANQVMTSAGVFGRFTVMKRPAASLLLLFFIGTILFGCATPVRTPVTSQRQIAGVGNLRAEQLKALIDRKAEMVLVDTRTEYEFKQGRIPGAINIAPHRFGSLAGILPRDKSIHLVFYCRGSA